MRRDLMLFKALIACACLALGGRFVPGVAPAGAQTAPDGADPTIQRYEKEAESVQDKIQERKAEVRAYDRKAETVLNRLNETERMLSRVRKKIGAIESERAALEARIAETEAASAALGNRTAESAGYVARRLTALYKLHWLGKLQFLAASDSLTDFIALKTGMEKILAYDETVLNRFSENKQKLQGLLEDLGRQKAEKSELEKEYAAQVRLMAAEKAKRAELLSAIRSKKSHAVAALNALKAASAELERKIASLRKKPAKTEKPENAPSKPFPKLKGLLNMPVKGNIKHFFGAYKDPVYDVSNFRSGIDIQAEKGASVTAVSGGQVIFSDWFKGYGNMIIIDHGDNYYTVYAHADQVFKSEGQWVKAGEVIATAGDAGALTGAGLHFEIRHHGKPIDPMKWLKKG